MDMRSTGAGKIALIRVVGTLLVIDTFDQFRDQKIQVHITLTVGMAAGIDRHPGNKSSEVGAMIKVEAAQKILVSLAFTTMLGDDQTRHKFQHLAGAQCRTVFD